MADVETLARKALALTDAADWPGREALFAEDVEFVVPMAALRGRAATTAFSEPFIGAFSEAAHRVAVVVAAGDTAVVEGVWVGTHTGPLVTPDGEIPATGRTVELPFAMVVDAKDGQIRSTRIYFDQLAFLGHLGLLPEPARA